MMTKFVYEVLEEVAKKKSKKDKVAVLKDNESWALKDVIRGTMDKSIQWNLPAGQPPYEPSDGHNHPSNLLKENEQFKYFVKGGPGDKLPPLKRENIFIGLIEGVHPQDAKLVIAMINKEKPKGLSKQVVQEAFPGLLRD